MRANNLHAPASVVYVVYLNCLRKGRQAHPRRPAQKGFTKLKLLIAVGIILTALFPAAVSLRFGSPSRDGWLFRIYNVLSIACGDYVEMFSCVSVEPVASNYLVHNLACFLDT